MPESRVWVFFYGSFINLQILARGGLVPDQVEVGRLHGFDIVIETLATLRRSKEHVVYGIVCQASHGELRSLYGQDWLGGTYLPEAVFIETDSGRWISSLCYVASIRPPTRPAADYLDWIIGPAREYGFPDSYIERLESFAKQPSQRTTLGEGVS
jgi:hypothetical protein